MKYLTTLKIEASGIRGNISALYLDPEKMSSKLSALPTRWTPLKTFSVFPPSVFHGDEMLVVEKKGDERLLMEAAPITIKTIWMGRLSTRIWAWSLAFFSSLPTPSPPYFLEIFPLGAKMVSKLDGMLFQALPNRKEEDERDYDGAAKSHCLYRKRRFEMLDTRLRAEAPSKSPFLCLFFSFCSFLPSTRCSIWTELPWWNLQANHKLCAHSHPIQAHRENTDSLWAFKDPNCFMEQRFVLRS